MKKCERCGTVAQSEFCPNCSGEMIEVEEVNTGSMKQKPIEIEVTDEQLERKNDTADNGNYVSTEDLTNIENEVTPEFLKEGFRESKKDKSNQKWFTRKSFLIPTVVAVLCCALWLGNDSSAKLENTEAELESVKAELASGQTEYSEYKEEMEPFEEYSLKDIEQAKKIREKEEKEKQKQLEEEKKKGYNTGITYSQLARNPEKYEGKKIKFRGKVVQLIEGDGDEIQIRLAVDGNYDTILYCGYNKDIVSSRVLEDDYITIYGVSRGTITYESTMGGQITIPAAWVDKIDQ